jgi:hypothetical protein
MRRFGPLILACAGCSTHPVADFLDVVKPAPAVCPTAAPAPPVLPVYPPAGPVTTPPPAGPEIPPPPPPSWPAQ